MEAYYYGEGSRKIFCIYHQPDIIVDKKAGVLLCYPFGQEYIRSHRTFLKLAESLCSNGFHVFRFDYYGTGDSCGSNEEVDMDEWVQNTINAIEEFKNGSGISKIIILGFHLGATIALLAAFKIKNLNSVILWNPVHNGKDYLNELKTSFYKWLKGSFSNEINYSNNESIGFPITQKFSDQLTGFDVKNIKTKLSCSVLLFESTTNQFENEVLETIKSFTNEYKYCHIPDSMFWLKDYYSKDTGIIPVKAMKYLITEINNQFE